MSGPGSTRAPATGAAPHQDHAQSTPAHAAPTADLPVIHLRGVPLHAIDEPTAIAHVMDQLDRGRGGWIVTVNLQHMHRCEHDPSYRALVEQADLVVADGMPLVWAAKLQGTPLPGRVAGSDMISSLSAAAASRGHSIFLLGGDLGAAEGAARVLQERCPGLRIAGTLVPPFGFERDEQHVEAIREALMHAKPGVIYVALGSPKQEKLIERLRADCPGAWWIGVGISFSFLTGDVHRAPRWLQRLGLEWAHRLAQEPRRLARRYLVEGLPFAAKLLAGALRRRWKPDHSIRADAKSPGRKDAKGS